MNAIHSVTTELIAAVYGFPGESPATRTLECKKVQTNKVFEFESGDVQLWIEQESIHLLARGKSHGDPVELTTDTARQLAQTLNALADLIDN